MFAKLLCVLSLQLAAAKVKLCAKKAKLTRCDGSTPYGWDAFPYIIMKGFGDSNTCDGDPLNPFAKNYVRYDDSTPIWNMCCVLNDDSENLLDMEVRVIDHETLKNIEIGKVHFTKDDLPPKGQKIGLNKRMQAASFKFVEFLFMGWTQIPTHLQKTFSDCTTGQLEVTIEVYGETLIVKKMYALLAEASEILEKSGTFPVAALAVLVAAAVLMVVRRVRSSKMTKTPEQPAGESVPPVMV